MVASPVTEKRPATMADLEALPEGMKGEIIDGVLYAQPRPRGEHQGAIIAISDDVFGPFQRGRGGPGGWWILPEPGITAPGSPEFSPDLAGWRKERMPNPPAGRVNVPPQWICEILSPSTRRYDTTTKKKFYRRIGVGHLWLLDLEDRVLTVHRLEHERWTEIDAFEAGEKTRVEPFDDIEIDIAEWLPKPVSGS